MFFCGTRALQRFAGTIAVHFTGDFMTALMRLILLGATGGSELNLPVYSRIVNHHKAKARLHNTYLHLLAGDYGRSFSRYLSSLFVPNPLGLRYHREDLNKIRR
jgi:hypothetical protein